MNNTAYALKCRGRTSGVRALLTVSMLGILSGCVGMQQTATNFDPDNFTAQGKIALRYPNCPEYRTCKEEGVSASLDWRHQQAEDMLTFYDPLGQAQASLTYENGQIVIEEDGQARTTNEASLEHELGIPVPIESLRELVLQQQPDEEFEHEGWQVQVKGWQGQFYRSVRLRQDSYYVRLITYNIQ